ncbi:MAG: ABC transporter transmembrane domain-containing protein [Lachnospirales bacterium]
MHSEEKILKREYIIYIIVYIATSTLAVAQAFGYEHIISSSEKGESIWLWSILTIICIVLYFFTNRFCFVGRRVFGQKLAYYLQKKHISDNYELSYINFEKINSGEWLTKLFNDISSVANFYSNEVLLLIAGALEFFLCLVYGFIYSIELTLVILISSVLSVIVPKVLEKYLKETKNKEQENKENVNAFINNIIDNLDVIKSYSSLNFILKIFGEKYKGYYNSVIDNRKVNALNFSIGFGLGVLVNLVWIVVGIYLISIDRLTISSFVGFMVLEEMFAWPFRILPKTFSAYSEMKVSKSRLNIKYEKWDSNLKYDNLNNDVILKTSDLVFSYDNNVNVIKMSDFEIYKNERVALVGESGCGKSTTLKILLNLYDKFKGDVIWQEGLKVGYISQTNVLFNSTIRENITFFNEGYKEEDIIQVCKEACIYDFLMTLEKGLDTIIDDTELSGGQVQRVVLARVLLIKPDVFILDEFSASIDIDTQHKIFENLKKIDATFIMVLHKQEAINFCNRSIRI